MARSDRASRAELVDGEDDFAEVLGFFEVVVGGGTFVERPDSVHDGNETALGDELEDGAQLVPGAHVGAENGELAAEQETDIEFGVGAGGGTAGDEAAGGGQAFDTFAPGGFADVLEDDIHAAIVGEAANFLGDGHDAVMNNFVGTKLLGFSDFFVGACGGDYTATEEFGDLDGGGAYTAAGGENEDVFARLELRAIDKHVPSSLEDQRNGSGVSPIEILGIGQAIDIGAADEFGAAAINHVAKIGKVATTVFIARKACGTPAAGDTGRKNHFLADVDGTDFGADFGDFTGDVAAGDVGKGGLEAGKAATHPEVKMIEGTSANADEDLAPAELRLGNIGVLENGRVSVFLVDDGFHERPPRSEMKWCLTTEQYIVSR